MKKIILLTSIGFLALTSCKKESNTDGCWECRDHIGNPLQTICAGSEQEAYDKSGAINGQHTIANFRQYCTKK